MGIGDWGLGRVGIKGILIAQISTQNSCKSTVKVFNDGITPNEESAHNKLIKTRSNQKTMESGF